ncbi:udp-glucose dehydrogenase [hydrocarbon metagenome]|uniref:Udp-glucose dehydrogenase n=1 Tax=hydrocarbon metagenome TaxID=938273 RepID=A0A0W8F274_9ZZZZ
MNVINISLIGTGYVGSVTGTCLAELGHQIVFVDRDQKKLDLIHSGKSPNFEPGLEQLLQKNQVRITTTTDLPDAVRNTDLTFICVGTPSQDDGSIDLQQIRVVSQTIGKSLGSDDNYHTIILKSTGLPGTTETLVIPVLERESGKKDFVDFGVASSPEFLKEGSAVEDFFHTDRVVIGVNNQNTKEIFPAAMDDPLRRNPDIRRANEILGWKPQVPLEIKLDRIIQWMIGIWGVEKYVPYYTQRMISAWRYLRRKLHSRHQVNGNPL